MVMCGNTPSAHVTVAQTCHGLLEEHNIQET